MPQPADEPLQDAVFDGLRVIAVLTSEPVREHISRMIGEIDGVELEVAHEDGAALRAATGRKDMPDALFLESPDREAASLALKQIRTTLDGTHLYICVLIRFPTRSAIITLLREGADDVLSITPTA